MLQYDKQPFLCGKRLDNAEAERISSVPKPSESVYHEVKLARKKETTTTAIKTRQQGEETLVLLYGGAIAWVTA